MRGSSAVVGGGTCVVEKMTSSCWAIEGPAVAALGMGICGCKSAGAASRTKLIEVALWNLCFLRLILFEADLELHKVFQPSGL